MVLAGPHVPDGEGCMLKIREESGQHAEGRLLNPSMELWLESSRWRGVTGKEQGAQLYRAILIPSLVRSARVPRHHK